MSKLPGGINENNVFPDEGSLTCSPKKSMIFIYKQAKQNTRIELVTKPECSWRGGEGLASVMVEEVLPQTRG